MKERVAVRQNENENGKDRDRAHRSVSALKTIAHHTSLDSSAFMLNGEGQTAVNSYVPTFIAGAGEEGLSPRSIE